jgi:hypothetical protein
MLTLILIRITIRIMKTTATKQKVTLSIDSAVYKQLKQVAGERGVGNYVSNVLQAHLPVIDLEQSYSDMAAYELANPDPELQEWMDAPIDAPLPPEDFSAWRS